METKKSSKANLENRKLLFKEAGIVLTLMVVLAAFEWSTSQKSHTLTPQNSAGIIDEMDIPITQDPPPAPPAPVKEPVLSDIIDIVENDAKITNTFHFNSEDHPNLGVSIINYIPKKEEEMIEETEEIPMAVVEEKPKFKGGDQNDFTKWVFSQIQYPEIAKENGIYGRVTLQFTINTDGSLSDIKVLRGVDASLDKEAMRVVASSPKWTPGKQRGKAVKVRFVFPVIFQLK